uniref:NADH-ubiquinone oxidoreductase chain 4L n=1 Tax=Bostrichoidea sp. 2 KM-2017 TaxID=2219276 RepID=A0A346RJL9_9COLE|nr:NADH dehydrogenase subunit 4L [Bostrichoidea sp. 2 KM-2017]
MFVLVSLVFMFYMGLISFSLNRKHLLLMLLSLEFIVLSLFFLIIFFLGSFSEDIYFSMIFVSMGVCEGALGLSVLVSLVRTHGGDNFKSFSSLW